MSSSRAGGAFALALFVAVGALAGCTAPGETTPTDTAPAESAVGASSSGPTSQPEVVDFGFDADPALSDGVQRVEWAVPLAQEDRFTVRSPDDGNGNWSFDDTANDCRLIFFQGSITDAPSGADDRASSDSLLLSVFAANDPNVTAAIIDQYTEDAAVALWEQDGSADMRVFGGSDADGASQADIARRFGALGFDLYLSVACPPGDQDAFSELADLIDDQLIAVAANVAD